MTTNNQFISLKSNPHLDLMRFNVVLSITIVIGVLLIAFGIVNLIVGKIYAGIAEIAAGLIVLVFNLFMLQKRSRYLLPAQVINTIIAGLSLYLYWNGGFFDTGIFWIIVLPALFVATGGLKSGSIWIGIHIFTLSILFALSQFGRIHIAYSASVSLTALVVYGFSCFLALSYEINRGRYRREIKVLQGLLPVCSYCKKIRDKNGQWLQIENYFGNEADIDFSHGICPDCMSIHHPEYKRKK